MDQARRSGASLAQIGQSMGVTKQAAQKRFVPKTTGEQPDLDASQGFTGFSVAARNALVAAQNEAHAAGNAEIQPTHLLLGLLAETSSAGTAALLAQGFEPATVREAVSALLPARAASVPELVPYDGAAKKVLQLTFRQAPRMGHNHVGTGYLLLALLEPEDGSGLLSSLGVDKDAAEDFVTQTVAAARTEAEANHAE